LHVIPSLHKGGFVKSFFVLSFILGFSFQASAITTEFSCPETHPEYGKVLTELESFKEVLNSKLECKDVVVNFDKITSLLQPKNRKELLAITNGTDGKPLTAESAKRVQDFAGSITEEIATALSLIGSKGGFLNLFAGTNKCNLEREDEFQAIERLTKAAYVATNLVSKVAGPYGVPLQVGAETFFGVVKGLQSYSERKRNIDFDDFEKREFFEGAVCLMSKFDSDIRKLNNPESHLRHLKNARAAAQRVVSVLEQQDTQVKDLLERKEAGAANLKWIESEIVRYSEIFEFKSGGIGPPQLQSVKNTINKFLMETAAPDFIDWYATRVKVNNKDVVRKTSETLRVLEEDLEYNGLDYVQVLPAKIEENLSQNDVHPAYTHNMRLNYLLEAPAVTSLYFVSTNVKNVSERAFEFNSALGRSYDLWKLSDLNLRVTQEYCEFFQNTANYTSELKDSCEAPAYLTDSLKVSYQSFYLASLINDNPNLEILGPFDFRLENHKRYIMLYTKLLGDSFFLAQEGLDFDDVLRLDKNIRIEDGRLKAANEKFPPEFSKQSKWWSDVDAYADQFINESRALSSGL